MAEKGNNFRRGSTANQVRKSQTYATRAEKARVKPVELNPIFEKMGKITGLFLVLLSAFFLIAFTSYLFTWQEDQSYVSAANGGWNTLFMTQAEIEDLGIAQSTVQNWMGKIGALLSHQFIYKWFGIASFIFVGLMFPIGYRLLFKVRLVSVWKLIGYAFFSLVFLSVALGFIHGFIQHVPHFLEGEFGFWTNRLLTAQIGTPGVAGLLIFVALTALILIYNLDFKMHSKRDLLRPAGDGTVDETDEDFLDGTGRKQTMNSRHHRTGKKPDEDPEILEESAYRTLPVEFDLKKDDTNNVLDITIEAGSAATVSGLASTTAPATKADIGFEMEIADTEPILENLELPSEQIQSAGPALSIEKIKEEEPNSSNDLVAEFGEYDPKLDLSGYQHPTLDLLRDYGSGKITINNQELEANKDKIVETLANYNIEIAKIKATIGPTVTLYEIIPKPGVRISKIKNLEDDIALSLAALGIRIIAPMPGKGTIGIEVPNSHPEMVSMRSVLATEKFQNTQMDLPIALGKTISNEVFIADLAKMPHLLVAGATGQGKSVGINAILTSLLYKKHPAELKFVLVDPKKVELSLFKKIERHFLAKLPNEEEAIITDTKKVINTLNSLCIEMDQRYDLLKNAQVRNLKEYNVKFVNRRLNPNDGHRFMPFIVLIVDEFADLMMTAGKEVEAPIARLAQLARAVGIHLVIATQRPSVNIITGTIKANFPARLAFRVLSKVDSRTILDSGGADQLIGRGDMLLSTGSDLIRIQCAFVDTPEVEEISDFIGAQRGYPSAHYLPEVADESEGGGLEGFDISDRDAMFEDAARLIVLHQQGSTSLIQRKLKLGYNRAGRIIDQLEAVGIVGPFEGSKAREVLYPDEYSLEQFLDTLKEKDSPKKNY